MERTGTRKEILAALENVAEGCLGSPSLRREAAEAAAKLASDPDAHGIRVGQTSYLVRE